MKKRILSVFLIVAMLLPLCACQDSGVDTPIEPSEQESATAPLETEGTSPTETSAATEETDPAVTTDPTEDTKTTDPTEDTKTTDPTEDTKATDPTEDTKPTETFHVHTWADATCTSPRICTTCNANGGPAKGHNWTDASYTDPKHCTICGATEGSALVRPSRENFQGVTITIATHNYTGKRGNWFYKQIEQIFGCTINDLNIPAEVYQERVQAMIAEGNVPTIFLLDGPIAEYVALGEKGQFVDVMAPENLAKMPYFKSLFVDNKINNEILMMTAAQDGSHYILPRFTQKRNVDYCWFYEQNAFEEAGVEWDGDPDGFLNMLRKLKLYSPESYPLTITKLHTTLDYVISSFGANSSYASYDWNKGEWFFGATSNASYEMLSMYQTAYNEKLLHSDALMQNNGNMVDDIRYNKSFVSYGWVQWMWHLNGSFDSGDYGDGHIVPGTTPVGTNGMTFQIPSFSNTSGVMISTADSKAAECAMAILDWMYDTSEEGGAWLSTVGDDPMLERDSDGLLNWLNDEAGVPYMNDLNYISQKYGMFDGALTVRVCPESPYFNLGAEVAEAQKIGNQSGYFRAAPPMPALKASLASQYQKAQAEIDQMQLDFITENWTRADFDKWASEFNATYQPVLDYLNA